MSDPDNFSFSERNKRAKTTINVPPSDAGSVPPPQDEYKAPPPRDTPPPPPRDFNYTPPPPRDFYPEPLPPAPEPRRKSSGDDDDEEDDFELPVDPWRLLSALKKRWYWMIIGAFAFLLLGALAGYIKGRNIIRISLIQRDVSAPFEAGVGGEVFKPHPLQTKTLVSLMESPLLMQRVSAKAKPFISPRGLTGCLNVMPERETELVHVFFSGKDKDALVDLANLYAGEAVALTKETQLEDLTRTLKSYQDKEHTAGEEMEKAEKEMQAFREQYKSFDPVAETTAYDTRLREFVTKIEANKLEIELLDMQITNVSSSLALQSPVAQKLDSAREELRGLLTKYTEKYPAVQDKMRDIASLEQQLASAATNNASTNALTGRDVEMRTKRATLEKEITEMERLKEELRAKAMAVSDSGGRFVLISGKQEALRKKMSILTARRSETQFYVDNADGYYRILAPATLKDIDTKGRWMKLAMFSIMGLMFGILSAAAAIVVIEIADDRIKTAADVKRVTGLPLLASLGDLGKMTPAEQEQWAFRAWTALSGQLSRSANHGMVCGFISSTHGEGRTTWINLLVDAASQRGLRVLTISTRPSPADLNEMEKAAAETEKQFSEAVAEAVTEGAPELPTTAVMMTAKALAFPAEVSQKFTGPNALPAAHIALPGWVWNLERRRQFQRALAHWRSIESMVLLVELPPASVPEAVLLAENLPQLIWLADSGKPRARATREQLQTLRHAKCRLVGAVLNHEPKPVLQL